MEKSADRLTKYGKRLLILFLQFFCFFPLFAKNPSWEELRKLRFSKGQDYFFTATECPFYMEIENVRPENVQVSVNSLPDNVSFVASKKEVLMPHLNEDNEYVSGTKLILWFKFATPGTYRLRSIDVVINGGYYRLGFESVDVFENPKFILPELKIEFKDSAFEPVGRTKKTISAKNTDSIVFTVYTRYAVRINNCSWDIPENSLFKEVEVFENMENQNGKRTEDFSPEFYPLATFEWRPLISGKFTFPSILVIATAYNGSRYELTTPEYSVNVSRGVEAETKKTESSPFAYAFTNPASVQKEDSASRLSQNDIELLAELYSKERHSLPFSEAGAKREQFELSLNIPVSEKISRIPVFVFLCVLAFLILCGTIVCFVFKKYPAAFSLLFMLIFNCTLCFIDGNKISKKLAVYKGGTIYPIPEENISSGVELSGGTIISVVHSAGEWYYVSHNDTYGWIKNDSLILIK